MDFKTFYKLSYGMYIVGSKDGDKDNGMICNTAFQITSEPPTIGISINKQNFSHDLIDKSKVFTLSVLTVDAPMTFIGQFGFKSGRDIDKFSGINFKREGTGAPVALDYSCGFFEAEVINSVDVGTHTIFIGKVVNGEVLSPAEPMTYSYYHMIKGGKSPKLAPTYIKEELLKGGGN